MWTPPIGREIACRQWEDPDQNVAGNQTLWRKDSTVLFYMLTNFGEVASIMYFILIFAAKLRREMEQAQS